MLSREEYEDIMNSGPCWEIVLNATNDCNLRCPYCFTQHNPQIMTPETAKKALLWLVHNIRPINLNGEHPKFQANWFGGEPMLQYDNLIKPVIEWAKQEQLPIWWGMTTNCTLLTPKRLQFLRDNQVHLLYSLDGPGAVQNAQRPFANGAGSIAAVEKYQSLLTTYPYGGTFRSTITPKFSNQLFDIYMYARNKGFKAFFAALDMTDATWFNNDAIENLKVGLYNILDVLYSDITSGITPCHFNPIHGAIKDIFLHNIMPDSIFRCGLGIRGVGITPDGRITACQEHSTYEDDIFFIGDLDNGIDRDKHFKLISLYEDSATYFRESIHCQDCFKKKCCYANSCPSLMHRMYGIFTKNPNIACEWTKILTDGASLLLARCAFEQNEKVRNYIEQNIERTGVTTDGR